MALLTRRRFIKPDLPEGLFVLVLDPTLPNTEVEPLHDCDGPLDPSAVTARRDGTLTFWTEGLPYDLRAVKQNGQRLTLQNGQPVRIEPWPLS